MKANALFWMVVVQFGSPLAGAAQEAAVESAAPRLLRVHTIAVPGGIVGTFQTFGLDSLAGFSAGSGVPRVIDRQDILWVQQRGGLRFHPVRGAIAGFAAGGLAASFGGRVIYYGAQGLTSLLLSAVGASAPEWPEYPAALGRNAVRTVALGVAAGTLAGVLLPTRQWAPLPEWDASPGIRERIAVIPEVAGGKRTHRRFGAELGIAAGLGIGFLAGGGLHDPWPATVLATRIGAVGGIVGLLVGSVPTGGR